MKKSLPGQLISALLLAAAIMFSGVTYAGQSGIHNGDLHKKLEQCEAAFNQAQSGKLSQEEAWKARREHKKLAREILAALNKRNAEISTISNEEILENLRVMGRLLEMLATDHPAMTDEWGYPLIR
ncbi:MAG TPA: hypothetical protein ENI98_12210 [Gammaproteobacteria bacterium]|nr:hypothetical protein [Gammaproteobacteria bacterium]